MPHLAPPAPRGLQPFLGVVTAPVPPPLAAQLGLPEGFGLLVQEVMPDSPAKAAGVEKHDVLRAYDDQKLVQPEQLAALVRATGKGKSAAITVIRKGQDQKLTATIDERAMPERPMHEYGFFGGDGELREKFERMRAQATALTERSHQRGEELREMTEKAGREHRDRGDRPGGRGGARPGAAPGADKGLPDRMPPMRVGGLTLDYVPDSVITTVNNSEAHVMLTDRDGVMNVVSENGKRKLVAKDPAGAVAFEGPIDTDEQRQAVPEPFRSKLAKIQLPESGNSASASVSSTPEVQ